MKIVAVVQARMGSTRLPGKVLKPLGTNSQPALYWSIRAADLAGVDETVIATGDGVENHPIRVFARDNFIGVINGSEDDVLSRYRKVITETKADVIVRLTGDCPFLDYNVIAQTIALYKRTPGCMYSSNTEPPTWPDGLDCEVISSAALFAAHMEATRQSDRDTVTRFIARNRQRFPSATLTCPIPGLQKERWVLDSPEDYEFLKQLALYFSKPPTYTEILDLLEKHPELRVLERRAAGSYTRNQRFYEALAVEGDKKTDFRHSQFMLPSAKSVIPTGAQTFSKSHLQFPEDAPLFLSHGQGGWCYDIDGNDYVDMVSALLPNVLGYCDPDIDHAIHSRLSSGISLSLSTILEFELAHRLTKLIPCAEMVKFGKNGSDVTAAAIRVSRAYTQRDRVLMIDNGYHGWQDWSVANTERGLGVPKQIANLSSRCKPDLNIIERKLRDKDFACVILEPEGRSQHWLAELSVICRKTDTPLVFDEVITGFRWSLGGYQEYVGVTPDLATFGKAMANGMPLSALVGRSGIMKKFAPPDNVFYSGTFFGEALSLAASIATIDKMQRENVIDHLWSVGGKLRDVVQKMIKERGLGEIIGIKGDAPLARLWFSKPEIAGMFRKWMIESGTLIIGSNNICFAHGHAEVLRVMKSYEYTLDRIKDAVEMDRIPKGLVVAGGVR